LPGPFNSRLGSRQHEGIRAWSMLRRECPGVNSPVHEDGRAVVAIGPIAATSSGHQLYVLQAITCAGMWELRTTNFGGGSCGRGSLSSRQGRLACHQPQSSATARAKGPAVVARPGRWRTGLPEWHRARDGLLDWLDWLGGARLRARRPREQTEVSSAVPETQADETERVVPWIKAFERRHDRRQKFPVVQHAFNGMPKTTAWQRLKSS
jgi:hypothetical protein